MKITFISDTHNHHKDLERDLVDSDIIIHAGDATSRGWIDEIKAFLDWYNNLNYNNKILIAGNHDWGYQIKPNEVSNLLKIYDKVIYLQDNMTTINVNEQEVKIYGAPWQPFFYDWAFNLFRKSPELKSKWDMIPEGVDILITHGPAYDYVDKVIGRDQSLGCELLTDRIKIVKPKIHVCGHIHSGHGYDFDGDTHYINASSLNERYVYAYKPIVIDWNPVTNEIIFLNK